MPLPPPTPRQHIHRRQVHCNGYRREDGLWDIEGHLTDTKSYAFDNVHRGSIEPGVPIHEMWMRMTVDDGLEIRALEAATDFAPYHICPEIIPNFQRLLGLRIGPGFRRKVAERVGGTKGCTHLLELLGPMATTAFQTMAGQRRGQHSAEPGRKPRFLDTCHAHSSTGVVVKELYPQYYTGE